jgi:hypothetical protein
MKRQVQAVWAGAWVLFMVAGCSALDLTGFFALQGTDYSRDRVVSGSLDAAAQSTRASLEFLGMSAKVDRDGETVRVASQTPSGARFTLVLTKEKGHENEQTRVHLEWNGNADDQAGVKILSQIQANRRTAAGS